MLIFLLVAFAAVFPDVADKNFKLAFNNLHECHCWFYILAVALILLSVTFLGLSRYGDIKPFQTMRSLISGSGCAFAIFRQGWGSA
ncbi:BCCT family transporter [Escherichia coli]|uniref:BCCT family transporter n=1 Tax=Escherichia coli TaxID=562 RepID=UPI0020C826AC|nr:BCCT family transporter [Escherichia coli]MCP8755534.1 BCCT family transporter [Escherichia coli]